MRWVFLFLWGGYQFNSWRALEAFYRGYGRAEPELYAANKIGAYVSEQVMLKASGFELGLVATWPVTPEFSLLARVDGVNLKSEVEFTHSSALSADFSQSVDDTKFTPGFGLGVQYDYGYGFLVRGEYQRMEAEVEFPVRIKKPGFCRAFLWMRDFQKAPATNA
ncbi:MAG: outer membrane beta-barrel protein [Moraxellaceae bacterium]